jgi:hypothetical protein
MIYLHIKHFHALTPDSGKDVPPMTVYWSAANLLVATALCIAYGRPYSVFWGFFAGFACLCAIKVAAGHCYDWSERLMWAIIMLCAIGEYFYREWSTASDPVDNEDESE